MSDNIYQPQNFDFDEFKTFSRMENKGTNEMITRARNSCENNFKINSASIPSKITNHELTHFSSFNENNSQYKSIKSNNTSNNYCSIHQINGNFQSYHREFHEISIFPNF